jgi:capsular polysaccharide biosynthesis protein
MQYTARVLREREPGVKAKSLFHFDGALTDEWLLQWHKQNSNQGKDKLAPSIEIRYYDSVLISGYELSIHSSSGLVLDDNCILPETIRLKNNEINSTVSKNLEIIELNEKCIIYQSHGANVYGHFIIDMLPRLLILSEMNEDLSKVRIVSRHDIKQWHKDAIKELFLIEEEQFFYFDPRTQALKISRAIVPSFTRNDAGFHPYTKDLLERFIQRRYGDIDKSSSSRRLIIDRRQWKTTHSVLRKIKNIDYMLEALKDVFAAELIDPSILTIREQIGLFSETNIIIGEYSSALHNSLFAPKGSHVISIGHLNLLQSSICALKEQEISYISTKQDPLDNTELHVAIDQATFLEGIKYLNEKIQKDHSTMISEAAKT